MKSVQNVLDTWELLSMVTAVLEKVLLNKRATSTTTVIVFLKRAQGAKENTAKKKKKKRLWTCVIMKGVIMKGL